MKPIGLNGWVYKTMTVTVVALTSVKEDAVDALSTYLGTTSILLERAEAKIVSRMEISETIVGVSGAKTITVVEYPSRFALSQVFDSAEYGLLKEIREQTFSHYQILMWRAQLAKISGCHLVLFDDNPLPHTESAVIAASPDQSSDRRKYPASFAFEASNFSFSSTTRN